MKYINIFKLFLAILKYINLSFKLHKANPDLREGTHPISRLYQIQQAKKEPEPIYKILKSEAKGKYTKFFVEVFIS